jgi:ankyrin repeat protein
VELRLESVVRVLFDAGANPNSFPHSHRGTPLQTAVSGNLERIVHLVLEHGAAVNPEWLTGLKGDPLRAAIDAKNETLFHLLLDHGASYNRTGREYDPPFQLSASVGFLPAVQFFVAKGVDLNVSNSVWGTALRAALAEDHENVVRYLLEQGADYEKEENFLHSAKNTNYLLSEFEFPLEIAAATNNPNLVQALLDYGLGINFSAKACERALCRAVQMPDMTMLDFLAAHAADIEANGHRALAVSCRKHVTQRVQKAKLLLSLGAKVNQKANAEALSNCIEVGDDELLEVLLDAGCDVNITHDLEIGCALNAAVKNGNPAIVAKLLGRGANVNLQVRRQGPLIQAIVNGDEQLFNLFLARGADIDPDTPSGQLTPLEAAIFKGYFAMANELIDRGANIHKTSRYGSLLTPAVSHTGVGQLQFLERLLDLGIDLNAEDPKRGSLGKYASWRSASLTPLQAAIFVERQDLAELLLERGAAINPKSTEVTWCLPLMAAAWQGKVSMIQLLLGHGAEINAVGGKYGTALQAAADGNHKSAVELLLQAGADPSIEAGLHGSAIQALVGGSAIQTLRGSDIQVSVRRGEEKMLTLLLDHNAPVNTSCGECGCPLAAAAKCGIYSLVQILLDHQARTDQYGGKYGFPLQAACCNEQKYSRHHGLEIIQRLLDNGADVNAAGGKYGTALQAAACHNWKYVELLLQHGADPTIKGGKYGSPYLAAVAKQQYRAAKLLVDYGATAEESVDNGKPNARQARWKLLSSGQQTGC